MKWTPVGAAPNTGGQNENIVPNNEVVGAIEAIACHPSNANILYVGAVNGGIWRTENALAMSPSWTILTDEHESLSIGAIEFDPLDQSNKTLVAGIGGLSSFGTNGSRLGILRTTDGLKWSLLNGMGAIEGLSISGVVPRGNSILFSSSRSDSSTAKAGIWHSGDQGLSWSILSGTPGNRRNDNEPFSFHRAGSNVLFADCRVQFINESVDYLTFAALCTASAGELVP